MSNSGFASKEAEQLHADMLLCNQLRALITEGTGLLGSHLIDAMSESVARIESMSLKSEGGNVNVTPLPAIPLHLVRKLEAISRHWFEEYRSDHQLKDKVFHKDVSGDYICSYSEKESYIIAHDGAIKKIINVMIYTNQGKKGHRFHLLFKPSSAEPEFVTKAEYLLLKQGCPNTDI